MPKANFSNRDEKKANTHVVSTGFIILVTILLFYVKNTDKQKRKPSIVNAKMTKQNLLLLRKSSYSSKKKPYRINTAVSLDALLVKLSPQGVPHGRHTRSFTFPSTVTFINRSGYTMLTRSFSRGQIGLVGGQKSKLLSAYEGRR